MFKICSPKRFQTVNSSETRARSRSTGSRNQNINLEKNIVDYELDENNCNDEVVSLDSNFSHGSDTSNTEIDFDELLCILQEDYTKLVL